MAIKGETHDANDVEDPPSLQVVHDKYRSLSKALQEAGTNFISLMKEREDNLLSDWQKKVDVLQAQIDNLESEMEEKERVFANNAPLMKMTIERDYWQQQALDLQQELEKVTKMRKNLKLELEDLTSERDWLSNELKRLTIAKSKTTLEI